MPKKVPIPPHRKPPPKSKPLPARPFPGDAPIEIQKRKPSMGANFSAKKKRAKR